ncbi:MAG: M20 family metallo-hydrolase [Saprospiraceae bacterium]|nr:M20 family metallo-hydrolase [Saprospiraceae bacterium]
MNVAQLQQEAIDLLAQLIALPSFSKEEAETADLLEAWMLRCGLAPERYLNNVYAVATNGPGAGPVVLLNSHHDTVKPASGWLSDPFLPKLEAGKLIGLGSNDAGASVVSMLAAFRYLSSLPELPYQLMIAITAEEEISGRNGVEALLPRLPEIDLGIVGEPTQMRLAVAERGLMVLDVEVQGKTGHAARNEGDNALYKALDAIQWFRNYQFEEISDFLGPVSMNVTQIEAGTQHNVVPDRCKFVVDIRLNGLYSHEEVLEIINQHISGTVTPRSTRLQPSHISTNHPFVQHAQQLGFVTFGSSTMSDQALMDFTTVKIGPGKSARSHTPEEFVMVEEIEKGVLKYIELLEGLRF